jgi:iron(III) transport system substrate-binding protein
MRIRPAYFPRRISAMMSAGGTMNSAWRNTFAIVAIFAIVATVAFAEVPDPSARIVMSERADREQFLARGAQGEGEVTVYTSLISDDLAALSAAFEKKYGVKVRGWRAGSEKVLQRAVTEARANRHDADVIETNGPELESLYREKVLQPFSSPHLKDLMPQAVRPHGQWVGTRINLFVQSYNTQLVKREDLPKAYADLTDPRWKGKLGIEAEDVDWFATAVRGQGEAAGLRTFREIARVNGFSVRKGHTLLAGLVASGEIAFALTTYGHGAEKMKQKGAPVDWYAIEPAIGRANGVAIVRRPPHPYAAALFADFILSPEGQKILERGGYVPANLRVGSAAQKLKLTFVDPALVLDEDAKWKRLWSDIVLGNAR